MRNRMTRMSVVRVAVIVMLFILPAASALALQATELFKLAVPSVVVLEFSDDNWRTGASGTGFVVAPNVVATSYHLIYHMMDGQMVEGLVTKGTVGRALLPNSKAYAAVTVLLSDPTHDLMIVGFNTGNAPSLKLVDPSRLEVGSRVYALGNPEGLSWTITDGLYSGPRVAGGVTKLQISAPVSHGSSGGPILNEQGEVIGVLHGGITEAQNLNFAVSSAHLIALLRQLPAPAPVAAAPRPAPVAPTPAVPQVSPAPVAAAPPKAPAAPAPAGPQVASGLYTRPGDVFRDTAEGPEMVVIPAGRFTMGSPSTETGRAGDEGPAHVVAIAKSFAAGKYEVTFAEWDACVVGGGCNGYRPADQGWGRGSRPVINVSWEDAKAYVGWLSQRTGQQYRLLTESEWEYAARAGTSTRYWWGDLVGRGNANCDGCGTQWDGKQTAPAGSFKPNAFGLHDMLGNVLEWVEDCWHDRYTGAPTDGTAWTVNCTDTSRGLRGGSWFYYSVNARSADRNCNYADVRDPGYADFRIGDYGFRVARTL